MGKIKESVREEKMAGYPSRMPNPLWRWAGRRPVITQFGGGGEVVKQIKGRKYKIKQHKDLS